MTGLARKSGGNALLGEVSDTWRTSAMTEWRNTGANITRRPWETQLLGTRKGCLWKCLPSGCFAVTTWGGYIVPLCTHFVLCKSLDKHKAARAGFMGSVTLPPSTQPYCSRACWQAAIIWKIFKVESLTSESMCL